MEREARSRRCARERRAAYVAATCLLLGLGAALAGHAQIESSPQAGRLETAYTLGKGGFAVSGGYLQLNDRRLPGPGGVPIKKTLNLGGVALPREVVSFSDGGLIPIALRFSVGEATDLYLNGTLFSGTSQKTVRNFYGLPEEVLVGLVEEEQVQYDRVYDQPIFDFGLGIKHQIKREVGDGLPAVAFGLAGRFGYSADDFEGYQDSTPDDGFPDFGGTAYLAVSRSFGSLLVAHGLIGLSASQKLSAQSLVGGAVEYSLIPGELTVVADYATRRDVNGFEYKDRSEKLTIGIRYRLASGASIQILMSPGGHLLVNFARTGKRVEPIRPAEPQFDDQLF